MSFTYYIIKCTFATINAKIHFFCMAKNNHQLHLKGYVGGWDFDADYVDYILGKNQDSEVHVLIDSLGGSLAKALSIVASFRNHGNVHVHYVGMNASAATIASLGAKHVSIDSSAMYKKKRSQTLVTFPISRDPMRIFPQRITNLALVFVIRCGFEPQTDCLEGSCSIQLSYRTKPLDGK